MAIFHRRYLCLFSFFFLLASFLATYMTGNVKILLAGVLFIFLAVSFIFIVSNKKRRFLFLVILMCLAFSLVAIVNSFLFITLPEHRAEECLGENPVEMKIISQEYSSDTTSEYIVKVTQLNEENTDIKAYLYCDFPSDLSYGDRVITLVDLRDSDKIINNDKSILLEANVVEGSDVFFKPSQIVDYFSIDGLRAICAMARACFINYVDGIFDGDSRALIKGFLINDRTDISAKVTSDFRRSGVSHLLAVSGLHIALLLGTLEFVLKKIFIPKKIRCILVAVFGVLFLALTNFAPSAVRSALMLFAVYASFMFSEDSDSLTSLFTSVCLMTLFSPYSIYDVGLMMSFFATLGLITVYPFLEKKLPKANAKNRFLNLIQRFLLWIVKSVLITLVANFFILPILWYYFGEMSLVSVAANILLSPLSSVYIPFGVFTLLVAKIPFWGELAVYAVSFLGEVICNAAEFFAVVRGAVVSLNYPFAAILVIFFTLSSVILLIVKLKRKIFVCLPAASFVILFSICLAIFSFTAPSEVVYVGSDENEFLIMQRGSEVTVCDVSTGSTYSFFAAKKYISPYSTEIENYVVTHAHKNHAKSIELILSTVYVRNLYLPLTENKDELVYLKDIYDVAEQYNTNVIFYQKGEAVTLFEDLCIFPYFEENEEHTSVCICVEGDSPVFSYSDAYESDAALKIGAHSRYFLIGEHGSNSNSNLCADVQNSDATVIFANSKVFEHSRTKNWHNDKYTIVPEKNDYIITLPLD